MIQAGDPKVSDAQVANIERSACPTCSGHRYSAVSTSTRSVPNSARIESGCATGNGR
jgi:hypothetical protein